MAAVVSLFPTGGLKGGQVNEAAPGVPVVDLNARDVLDFRYSGLIDPHNGDNGTDPAQTTTGGRWETIRLGLRASASQ